MSLALGSVTVSDEGVVAASAGIAKRFFDADVATLPLAAIPVPGDILPPYSVLRPCTAEDVEAFQAANVRVLQEAARRATANAIALFAVLTQDAHAVVTTESLGKTPDPNDPGVSIAAPDSPVELPIQ